MRTAALALALLLLPAPAALAGDPPLRDRIALAKLSAGTDPARLRRLAAECRDAGLEDEARHLVELARGIELDERVAALDGVKSAEAWLELARWVRAEGYPEHERRAVLTRALGLAPDDASVRFELGQVRRQGRWVTFAEARELDRHARETAGKVLRGGRWVDAATARRIDRLQAEARSTPGLTEAEREELALEREVERRRKVLAAEAARRESEAKAALELARVRLEAELRESRARALAAPAPRSWIVARSNCTQHQPVVIVTAPMVRAVPRR